MPAPSLAQYCAVVKQGLEQVAGVIGKEAFQQYIEQDPFAEFVTRDTYNLSNGEGQQYVIRGRADLTPVTWTPRVGTDGTANPPTSRCEPPVQNVSFKGQNLKTTVLEELQLQSPMLCLEDLRSMVNPKETVQSWVDGLKEKSVYVMNNWTRDNIFVGSGVKVVAKADGNHVYQTNPNVTSNAYPATQPTGTISHALLTAINRRRNFYGAGKKPFSRVSGQPIQVAYLGVEAYDEILRGDPKFRSDIRYAWEGAKLDSPLLGPLGSAERLRDTAFVVIERPRRFTYSGGVFTEVQPWLPQNDTIGTESVPNPAYEDINQAPYEEVLLPHKDSFIMSVPESDYEPTGELAKYGKQTYMGEWHFKVPDLIPCVVNGTTTFTNVKENQGFFWAYWLLGKKYPFPQYSASLVFARCGFQGSGISCGSYAGS